MRQTLRLGRVAGIRIGANAGVLVIVAIIIWGLAAVRFPMAHPGRSVTAYVITATVTVLLFLASLLAHELAHALIAQSNGVHVESITLWLFGGVTELRGEVRSAGAEFAVAVVGPATSFILGGMFGVAAGVLSAAQADRLVVSAAWYLAVVNIVLAVFNLLPAAPLDGGRVLRAAVWKATGDRVRAAVVAARAGRVLGFTMILLGVGLVLLTGALASLWWALIGWFLVHAAMTEEEQARLNQKLAGIRVGDVMSGNPVTVAADTPLSEFVSTVAMRHRFSTYPMVDSSGRLTGLATLNRIRAVPVEQRESIRVGDIACPPAEVPTARADEPLIDLLPRLAGCTDGRAAVVDEAQRVIGLLSPTDISRTVSTADLRGAEPYPPRGTDLSTASPWRNATGSNGR